MGRIPESLKQGFRDSKSRFNKIDGDNFGASLKSLDLYSMDTCIEWRIHKEKKTLFLIEYYGEGKGYALYEQEQSEAS